MKSVWLAEERRVARERKQAEEAEAARREAALVAAQAREKANRETRERLGREAREREMGSLRLKVKQWEAWQHGVERAAHNAVRQQQTLTLMGEFEKMLSPPALPPEPDRGRRE